MIVPFHKNPKNGFTVARVHYSLDPDKNTKEWLEKARKGMSDRAWNREYEIDYTSYAGKPYYPEFKEYNLAKQRLVYVAPNIIYRGWDFGFHRPCMLITWLNEFDQWYWDRCVLGQDEGIMQFGKRCVRFCQAEYPGAKYIDWCDPAGGQQNDKSEQTSVQILNMIGVYPQHKKQEIREGSEIIRQKLHMRVDGKPGLLINPEEIYLIDAMKGGLHYPDSREGEPEKEYYEKEGYFEHGGDTARYIATGIFTVLGQSQLANEIAVDPNQEQFRMGRPSSISDNTYGGLSYANDGTDEYNDNGMGEFF